MRTLMLVSVALCHPFLHAQQALDTSAKATLNGNYYFRWVVYSGIDSNAAIQQAIAAYGTISFDGSGNYKINGQIVSSVDSPRFPKAFTPNGTYAVSSGGMAEIQNPIFAGDTLYAGVGVSAVVGSSTEHGNHDMFVAIPAPAAAVTNAALTGVYRTAFFDFAGGAGSGVTNGLLSLASDGKGGFAPFPLAGSSATGLVPTGQTITGASYSLRSDGSGTAAFPTGALVSGGKTIYLSNDGDIFLAGSPTGFDIMVGIHALSGDAANESYNGLYFSASIQHDLRSVPYHQSLHGARNVQAGRSWYQERINAAPDIPANHYDGTDNVALAPFDAAGTYTNANFYRIVGSGGRIFLESGRGGFYELYVGVKARPFDGSGFAINPYGIVNGANLQPPTNPVAPGEVVSIFGSGFATTRIDASSVPLPSTLNSVEVKINGRSAPLLSVGPDQINLMVPYATTEPYANFEVSVGGRPSNSVTAYSRATAPGVFTIPPGGAGDAAALHADYSLVSSTNGAKPGEIVMVFLTGLGTVSPSIGDGAVAPLTSSFNVVPPATNLAVYIAGVAANVSFAGLAPGFAGLYQINVEVPGNVDAAWPAGRGGVSSVPLEIDTKDGATLARMALDLSGIPVRAAARAPINTAPVANSQSVSTAVNTGKNITLTGTDPETPGGLSSYGSHNSAPHGTGSAIGLDALLANLTFNITSNPAHGSLSGTPPNLTYTPVANYIGPDSFQFTTSDRGNPDNCGTPSPDCAAPLTSSLGTVSITVIPVNTPPIANLQSIIAAQAAPTSITLTGSDPETPAGNLSFTVTVNPTHGTLSGAPPNLTYTPVSGYAGPDSLQFTITDGGSPDACGTAGPACAASLTSAPATVTIAVQTTNKQPVANTQTITGVVNTPINITLTGSDIETPAGALIFAVAGGPNNGTLSGTAPNLVYIPNTRYVGVDTIKFTVTDRGSPDNCGTPGPACAPPQSSVGFININIPAPVNSTPIANTQSVAVTQNTAKAITLTGSDLESPVLAFIVTANPVHGTLSGSGANLLYTPATNYTGPDSFQFKATDRGSPDNCGTPGPACAPPQSSVGFININIPAPVNSTPIANTQSVAVTQNTAKAITLTGSDLESPVLAFIVTANPVHGTLSGSGANLLYTPATNYTGPDSFQFKATDRGSPDNCGAPGAFCAATLDSLPATVSITVLAGNSPPAATPQSVSTNEGVARTIVLGGTDLETAPANLSFTIASGPAHGTLSGVAPNLTYTGTAGYFGPDSFQFKVRDRGNPDACSPVGNSCAASVESTPATVSITIIPVNTAPSATAQTINTNANAPKAITLAGTDAESAAANLSFTVTLNPAHGTLSGTAPNLTYTPNSNYTGTDAFQFTVTDRGKPDNCGAAGPACSGVLTSTGTVSISVLAVNTPPTANGQSVSTNESTAKAVTLTGSDPETAAAILTFKVTANPAHGILSGTAPNLTYTPNAGYFGPDSFQFTATDRGNPDACSPVGNLCAAAITSAAATVSIAVVPVNTAPAANAQSVNANQNSPKAILLAGTDAETSSASLGFTVASNPSHGTLSGTAPNLTYTPNANYIGPDSFQFTATDRGKPDTCGTAGAACSGALTSAAATVNITVVAVNTAPTADGQNVSTNESTALPITLAGTDSETASANLSLNVTRSPSHGALTGTVPNLIYTPNAGYFGADNFQFTVTDRGNPDNCGASGNNCAAILTSAAGTINITVIPVNTAPTATPQSVNVNENSSKGITLAGADTETLPGNLSFTVTANPAHGTLSGSAPNLSYTPNHGYMGTDSFQFTVTDRGKPDSCGAPGAACSGALTSAAATVGITVVAVNTAPTATPQSLATNEGTGLGITLSGADAETAPANLSFNVTAGPVHGVLSGAPPNLVYTPATGYFGVDSFQFTVTDRGDPDACSPVGSFCSAPLTSAAAAITITIVPVNTAPTATAQSVNVNENDSTQVILAGTDAETASANLSFQVTVNPTHGSLSGTAPTLTYTPNPNYFGPDSFQFTVTDRGNPDTCGAPNLGCSAALTSTAATVSITVAPFNTPPTGFSQSASTNESTGLPIALTGSDLQTASVNLTFTISTPPAHGSFTGTPPAVTYIPAAGYFGTDSFQYTVSDRGSPDGCGHPNPPTCLAAATSQPVAISVTIRPVNVAPAAVPQTVGTNQDTPKGFTLAGTDAETSPAGLTFSVTTFPSHGLLSGTAPNLTYTPAAGYFGNDSFQFTVTDRGKPDTCGAPGPACSGALTSAPATVSITVTPVNTAPTANSQSITTTAGTPAGISLTGGDIETPPGNLSFNVTALPSNGSLSGSAPNLTYTPAAGYVGADSFQFTVTDRGKPDNCGAPGPNCAGPLTSTSATVSISVTKPPVIVSGSSATFQPGRSGQAFTVQTTGFPSGASMSITAGVGLPSGVLLTNNNDGTASISGTPAAGSAGSAGNPRTQAYPVTITANNGVAPNGTQSFILNVTCPVITISGPSILSLLYSFDSASVIPNPAGRTYSQSGGSAPIAFTINGQPSGISINSSTGVISGIAAATGDFNAAVVTATDAGGCSATKTIDIAVAPIANTDSYTTLVDNTQAVVVGGATPTPGTPFVTLTGSLIANDLPAGNVTATAGAFITSNGGSVLVAADGTFIYTPNVNPALPANTTDSFTYQISSNSGGTHAPVSSVGTVNLSLAGRVWYVRSTGSDFSNTGQSHSPFLTLAKAAGVSLSNDTIFLYAGNDLNLGGISLKQGQRLIGEGAGLTVNNHPLVAPGGFPTLGSALAGLACINVTGLTVTGLNISTGSVPAVFLLNSDGNFTFKSLSTSNGNNGIVWDNSLGSPATGSLTVTGDGVDTSLGGNATGGIMGNVSGQDGDRAGTAIWLNNVSNITLRRILINGTNQNFGIRGVNVNNFVLEYSTVGEANGNSTFFDEGSIIFDSLVGTARLTKVAVAGSIKDNFHVRNSAGSVNATIDGSTFTNASNHNVMFDASGTANVTARVTNNIFSGAGGSHLLTATTNSAILNIVFTGNFFSMGSFGGSLGGGVTISGGNAGSSERVNFNISNNGSAAIPLVGSVLGGAININQGNGNGVWQGQVSNNFIGNAAVPNSGCAFCSGIRVENHSNGSMTAIVSGNVIKQWNLGPAINTQSGDVGNTDSFNGTIANNTASSPGVNAQHGFVANMGAGTSPSDASQVCLDISSNTFDGNAAQGASGVRIQQQKISTVRLRGYTGAQFDTAAVEAFATSQNPGSIPAPTATTSGAGGGFLNSSPAGSQCSQPLVPQ